jgi:hypothetical protein
MESRYSVSTFIKNNGANHRRALIYIRITVNGKRAEISAKRSVDPNRWDSRANQMKGNKEDAKEINSLIDSLTLKINRIYSRLVENDEIISAEKIKKVFLGYEVTKKTLLEAFQIHNDAMKSRVGIDFSKSTFTRYSTTCDHIVQFLKQQYNANDIMLRDIQYSFIVHLEHFLKVTRKCNHNSSQKYIRNFRKIINNAIKNDWLDKDYGLITLKELPSQIHE